MPECVRIPAVNKPSPTALHDMVLPPALALDTLLHRRAMRTAFQSGLACPRG